MATSFAFRSRCPIVPALALAGSIVVTSAEAADDRDDPTAVPYRPTITTNAQLSVPGWLEIETGVLHDHDADGLRRDSLPTTLKLAFTPDWGVRIGADAWVHAKQDGANRNGYGDTSVVLKRRFAIDEQQAFGLEGGATFATAKSGLGSGSGKTDLGINAIYSADFGEGWHTDVNVTATRLGRIDPGTGRTQWLGAVALSKALDERWGVVGELSQFYERSATNTRQLLLGATYNVSKRLVLDAGAMRSLRSGESTWSVFAGLTWTAVRLF